uniref:Nucleic acid binding protein n=1 Tax=Solanum tuberosum TaxID=4113 RepID=M1BR82_SOLTU
MADSPSQKEIEDGLKDCANSLINIPPSTEELISLLDKVESLLIKVAQAPDDSMKDALQPVMEAVVRSELLKHTDADVIVSVVSCIYEISRISAPLQPYDDELMKEIFQLTVRTFEELSHSGRRYRKAVNVLETVAEVKACLILLDLDCHALVVEIIRMFLRIIRFHPIYTRSHSPSGPATTPQNGSSCGTFYSGVTAVERNKILRPPNLGDGGTYVMSSRPRCIEEYLCTMFRFTDKEDSVGVEVYDVILKADHPNNVFTSMEVIMILFIEESDEINMELLQPLLDSLRKENQIWSPISSKLGEKILKECASTVRPCLLKALKSRSMNLDEYTEIIASICNEIPKGEQMTENENVTAEKVGPSAAVICETLLEDGQPSNNNGTSSKTLQHCSQMEQPKNIGVSNCKVKSGSKRKPRQSSRKRGSVPKGDVDTTSGLNIVKRKENLTDAEESSVQQIDEKKQKKEIHDIEESGDEEIKLSFGDENLSSQFARTKRRRKLTVRKDQSVFMSEEFMVRNCFIQDSIRRQFTKKYGEEIVGTRIRVWWPLDEMFYEGAISGFDHVTKRHQIAYDDGETETLNLNKEQFEILEDNPSDKSVQKHEADLQCNAVSSVPSKRNPQKCDIGSMDIPIPDKMNAEVGCETSSGKKELVDKEDKDTTQKQRLENCKIALENSLTLEDHPSDKKHETDLQSHDVSAVLSIKKKVKKTSSIKKEPGVSSSKRSKKNPRKSDIGSMDIPIPDKMNDADGVGLETSSGKKELVQKEDNDITQKQRSKTSKVSFESSLALEVHLSDKKHEPDLQSNDASSVPSKRKPKKSYVESLDIPIPDKMNDAADVGCETSSGIKELVDKEQVAFESSLALEIQPSDKKHEPDLQSNDASSVPSKRKPKKSYVESLDILIPDKMNDAADVGCETSSGIKEFVDKEQVAFESSLALEIQPSDKNHETGPQSNDVSSSLSKRKAQKSDTESLDTPIPDKMKDASDVGCETISEKKLVDNEDDMFAQAESKTLEVALDSSLTPVHSQHCQNEGS